jgi:hypothetical protein
VIDDDPVEDAGGFVEDLYHAARREHFHRIGARTSRRQHRQLRRDGDNREAPLFLRRQRIRQPTMLSKPKA